jgi:predicted DCC family thiol-disulfide oxidoreductase YuxK
MARWVRRRDRAGRVLAVANQKPGALERYGLTREEADRAAWTIEGDGRRLEGASAINRVLHELGGGWRGLATMYRLPPVAAVEEAFYRWFAARRSRFHPFGVTPECDEPGAGCVT